MELLRLLFSIIVITFIGLNALYLISFRWKGLGLIEGICISFGLGIGLITLEMLCLSNITAPWLFVIAINIFLLFRKGRTDEYPGSLLASEGKTHNIFNYLLLSGVIFEVSYAFFRALIKPIESYDAIAIYAIKSKIFFLAKAIPHGFFTGLVNFFPHPDYPLNIPLAETFIYLSLGTLNDQLVKIIFPIFFLSILTILYFAIRRFGTRTYALVFTFILASVPQFNAYAANAYLDLPFAYYSFISALFLFWWFEDRQKTQFLVISAVMAGLGGWTKNEGLMYCVAYLALIGLFFSFNVKKISRRDLMHLVLYIVIVMAILAPWLWIKCTAHLVNSDMGRMDTKVFTLYKETHKLKPILYEFQKQFFGPKKWNILWPAIFLAFALNFKRAFKGTERYVSVFLILIVAGYIAMYMISPIDVTFFVKKTWSRFLIHFLPIAVYWLARILKEDINI